MRSHPLKPSIPQQLHQGCHQLLGGVPANRHRSGLWFRVGAGIAITFHGCNWDHATLAIASDVPCHEVALSGRLANDPLGSVMGLRESLEGFQVGA